MAQTQTQTQGATDQRTQAAPQTQVVGVTAARPGFTQGLTRPGWVNRLVRQEAIVVADGSGSMNGRKARDASAAILALVTELAKPSNKDAFDTAVVAFDDGAEVALAPTKATEAVPRLVGFNVVDGRGGSTNITAGLQRALDLVLQFEKTQNTRLRPAVLLFSDGGHNVGAPPDAVADQLRQKADLVCVAYAGGDEILLRRLATSPQHFYRCTDGAALRQFLAQVGATMSMTHARGCNATQALGQMQQQP